MAELASYLSIVPHMRSFDVPPKHSAPLSRGLFPPLDFLRREGKKAPPARFAIMADVDTPFAALEIGEVQATARTLGLDVVKAEIRRAEDKPRSKAASKLFTWWPRRS
jgi:hypothetical protein